MVKKVTKIYLKKPKEDVEHYSLRPRVYGSDPDEKVPEATSRCCEGFIDFLACEPSAFGSYIVFGIVLFMVFFVLLGAKLIPSTSNMLTWTTVFFVPCIWWILVAMYADCSRCKDGTCDPSMACCLSITPVIIARIVCFLAGVGCLSLGHMLDGRSIATLISPTSLVLLLLMCGGGALAGYLCHHRCDVRFD
jgi:hypothetical protein